MATGGFESFNEQEAYTKVVLGLIICGTKTFRHLLKDHVAHYGQTIDRFLDTRKSSVLNGLSDKLVINVLFPLQNKPTDVDTWDISLIIHVLTSTCRRLPEHVRRPLNELRKIRNTVFHCSEANLDESEYEDYWNKISNTIRAALNHVGDDAFYREVENDLKDIEHGKFLEDYSTCRRQLMQWCSMDLQMVEKINEVKEEIGNESQKTRRHLESKIDEMKTHIQELTLKMQDMNSALVYICKNWNGRPSGPPPDIQVLMRTSNGDGQLTPEIDSAIVRSYNNSEDGFDEADLTFTDKIPGIKLAVESCKHPNDGQHVKGAKHGSVILTIGFESFAAVATLLEESESGGLTQYFKPVQDAVRRVPLYENFLLEVEVQQDAVITFIQELVRRFPSEINECFGNEGDELNMFGHERNSSETGGYSETTYVGETNRIPKLKDERKITGKALEETTSMLENICGQLSLCDEIQGGISELVHQTRAYVFDYKNIMVTEGTAILAQKKILSDTVSNSLIRRTRLCLAAIIKKLDAIRATVVAPQTLTHRQVLACRAKKSVLESAVVEKNALVAGLQEQITSAKSELLSCEKDIAKFYQAAAELDERSGDIKRAGKKKRKKGRFGFLGGLVGVVLAPMTGGASVALAAAGVCTAGVNFNDANDCRRNAEKLRNDAEARRQQAADLRTKISSLQSQKSSASSEVFNLQTEIGNVNEATEHLEEMIIALKDFLEEINNAISRFEDMDTCFNELTSQTDSGRILQIALSENKTITAKGPAQMYIEQIRDKWTAIETTLMPFVQPPSNRIPKEATIAHLVIRSFMAASDAGFNSQSEPVAGCSYQR